MQVWNAIFMWKMLHVFWKRVHVNYEMHAFFTTFISEYTCELWNLLLNIHIMSIIKFMQYMIYSLALWKNIHLEWNVQFLKCNMKCYMLCEKSNILCEKGYMYCKICNMKCMHSSRLFFVNLHIMWNMIWKIWKVCNMYN